MYCTCTSVYSTTLYLTLLHSQKNALIGTIRKHQHVLLLTHKKGHHIRHKTHHTPRPHTHSLCIYSIVLVIPTHPPTHTNIQTNEQTNNFTMVKYHRTPDFLGWQILRFSWRLSDHQSFNYEFLPLWIFVMHTKRKMNIKWFVYNSFKAKLMWFIFTHQIFPRHSAAGKLGLIHFWTCRWHMDLFYLILHKHRQVQCTYPTTAVPKPPINMVSSDTWAHCKWHIHLQMCLMKRVWLQHVYSVQNFYSWSLRNLKEQKIKETFASLELYSSKPL